jgi:hypothetical protein
VFNGTRNRQNINYRTFRLSLAASVSGEHFGIRRVNLTNLRSVALIINTSRKDVRSASEQERNPIILDIGVCQAKCGSNDLEITSTVHMNIKENLMLETEARRVRLGTFLTVLAINIIKEL